MIDGTAIPKYLYGVLQWAFCLMVLFFIPKRVKGWKFAGLATIFLAAFVLLQLYFELIPLNLWILSIVGIYGLMVGFVYTMGRITSIQAIYLSAQAFVYAQFAAAFEWQFYYFFGNNLHFPNLVLLEYIMFAITLVLFSYLIFAIYRHYHRKGYQLEIKRSDMITVFSIAVIVFIISNLSFLEVNSPISSVYPEEIFYIRTLVDLCGVVVIMVLQEYQIIVYSQRELAVLQSVFHRHYNQYIQSRDNIKLANQRYHDIRHQINLIRDETDSNKKDQYLKDFDLAVKNYTIQADTGHGVIDTIVTSKSNTCRDVGINFSFVIDGKQLEFISTIDLTSLFGNMIDNAIESVNKVKSVEKKIINLNVYAQHALLIINIENYYEHNLKFENDKLITTKEESFNHGYGLKSIKHIVDKYDGTLRIDTKDNWFTLTILFPLKT